MKQMLVFNTEIWDFKIWKSVKDYIVLRPCPNDVIKFVFGVFSITLINRKVYQNLYIIYLEDFREGNNNIVNNIKSTGKFFWIMSSQDSKDDSFYKNPQITIAMEIIINANCIVQ